jgi:hypothetical protein
MRELVSGRLNWRLWAATPPPSMSAGIDHSSTISGQSRPLRCLVAAIALPLGLAACSTFDPGDNVPAQPEGLNYPSVATPQAPKGAAVLTPAERARLQSDLDRYRLGSD